MRKARGAALFQEYKKKMGMSQGVSQPAAPPAANPEQRQKIAE